MKNFLSLLLAAILGGLISFGFLKHEISTAAYANAYDQSPRAVLAHMNVAPSRQMTTVPNTDFVDASARATPAVVHIKANESRVLAQQRFDSRKRERSNPFGDLFGLDNIFGGGDFFGYNGPKGGSGSGVILSGDGYIVTNNHVVGFADEITVTLNDGRIFNATKVGTDPSSDLAVIKIEAQNLPTIPLADSDAVRVGEWVLAVGNPFDYLTSTVTAGIVSAKGRDIDIIKDKKAIEEFIQTDAAINPGNSGGALINTNGELIGINTAIATPTGAFAGYSFAIPSKLMDRIVKEIIETGGVINRAHLGIRGVDIATMRASGEDRTERSGVFVDKVLPGSSAQFAGLLPGDVIQKVNQSDIIDFDDLIESVKFIKVGDELELKILRKGRLQTIPVKIRSSS